MFANKFVLAESGASHSYSERCDGVWRDDYIQAMLWSASGLSRKPLRGTPECAIVLLEGVRDFQGPDAVRSLTVQQTQSLGPYAFRVECSGERSNAALEGKSGFVIDDRAPKVVTATAYVGKQLHPCSRRVN